MKLLLENWREYLNESGAFQVQTFGRGRPQAARLSANYKNRLVVIIDVPGYGPTAFYRSTGTGTPQLGTKNMWLPMGGFGARYSRTTNSRDIWLIKFEGTGKIPPEGHIMREVGIRLGKAYDKKPFSETNIESFASGLQVPIADDAGAVKIEIFNKCRHTDVKNMGYSNLNTLRATMRASKGAKEQIKGENDFNKLSKHCRQQAQMIPDAREWEAILVNLWFHKANALKKDWSGAAMTTQGDYLPGGKNDPRGNYKQIIVRMQQAKQGSQE